MSDIMKPSSKTVFALKEQEQEEIRVPSPASSSSRCNRFSSLLFKGYLQDVSGRFSKKFRINHGMKNLLLISSLISCKKKAVMFLMLISFLNSLSLILPMFIALIPLKKRLLSADQDDLFNDEDDKDVEQTHFLRHVLITSCFPRLDQNSENVPLSAFSSSLNPSPTSSSSSRLMNTKNLSSTPNSFTSSSSIRRLHQHHDPTVKQTASSSYKNNLLICNPFLFIFFISISCCLSLSSAAITEECLRCICHVRYKK